ncbi:claudin-10 [Scomber scombrus]|uniref:claudin-10 n=1 Tax=Scomber scombrus TaxID=13677 RepID=UPI002DD8E101|nr:claudin-10 [Scomber scombrus]
MKIRVVQIWGFLMTVLGWIFVACTMAMEGWKITSIGGMGGSSIIKVAWYWSSLWRSCFTDSTAVSNCYDYPMLWSVEGHIQIVRGLLMTGLSLGMLGFVLSLLGMECTFIGGKERSKYKKIFAGGWCHIIAGFSSTCGYAVYAQYVSVEYFNPDFDGLQYDLGTPVFLGWVGSAFHMTGGFFYLWSVCQPLCGGHTVITIQAVPDPETTKPSTALSTVSKISSKTKVSSISELSSRSESTDVSDISSTSGRTSKSGRAAKSDRSSKTRRTTKSAGSRSGSGSESGLSSRSSISTLSGSKSSRSSGSSSGSSSRTVSSLSGSSRSETTPFIKNSYI